MSELIGKVKVQQWEYHRVHMDMRGEVMGVLKDMGNDGWELVSFSPNPKNSISHFAYFKRPLP